MSFPNNVRLVFLIVALIGLIVTTLTSCSSRNGYGCHSNQSWGKMERRINRPY